MPMLAWQATESTNGANASLAERLRHAGEVVDDACLRRSNRWCLLPERP